jgi:transcriptional regulator with XRE-family HTH domain
MNATQSRMARAALQISVRDLAILAKVSAHTVIRLERGNELKARAVNAILDVFEKSKLVAFPDKQSVLLLVPSSELSAATWEWKVSVGLMKDTPDVENGEGAGVRLGS